MELRLTSTNVTASDLMGRSSVTVGPDATLGTLRQVLTSQAVDHALVVEDQRLRGVVTDRDVLRALSPYLDTASEQARDLQTLRRPVHQVMDHHPPTVRPDTGLTTVARMLTTTGVTCLPVVEATGRPLGVVTWRDLLHHLLPESREVATVPASRSPHA